LPPDVSEHRPGRRAEPEEGVYLVADDPVWPWLAACAESLRHFNPETRVIVMPYGGTMTITERLCRHYGFELWSDPSLDVLDAIGERDLSGVLPPQRMRRLAAFWGPLERFLYLDVDTVVLMDLAPVLQALAATRGALLFAHCDDWGGNLDEVYRPGPWRDEFVARHGSHAGNSGVFGAARGLFTREQIAELAQTARPFAGEFVYSDQGFLNFLVDVTGTAARNLHEFIDEQVLWPGVPGYRESGGALWGPQGEPVGLVHWAGFYLDAELPYEGLWRHWLKASPEAARQPGSRLGRLRERIIGAERR
jgi:hypothetical protein